MKISGQESQAGAVLGSSAVSPGDHVRASPGLSDRGRGMENEPIVERLVPPLPDSLVEEELWPLFAKSPWVLFQLRGVNKRWKNFVDSSIEWSAVNFILLDSPRLGASAASDLFLAQKLGLELANYRSWFGLTGGYNVEPPSEEDEGCSPGVEECPEIYD